jgi:hypothetical protein
VAKVWAVDYRDRINFAGWVTHHRQGGEVQTCPKNSRVPDPDRSSYRIANSIVAQMSEVVWCHLVKGDTKWWEGKGRRALVAVETHVLLECLVIEGIAIFSLIRGPSERCTTTDPFETSSIPAYAEPGNLKTSPSLSEFFLAMLLRNLGASVYLGLVNILSGAFAGAKSMQFDYAIEEYRECVLQLHPSFLRRRNNSP